MALGRSQNILSSSLSSEWRTASKGSAPRVGLSKPSAAPSCTAWCAAEACAPAAAGGGAPAAASAGVGRASQHPVTTRHVRSSAGLSSKKSTTKTSSNSRPLASKMVSLSAEANSCGRRSLAAWLRTKTAWCAPNSIWLCAGSEPMSNMARSSVVVSRSSTGLGPSKWPRSFSSASTWRRQGGGG